MRRPRAIDLFAGCGGLTLGLKQAGFNVVGAVEIDRAAASCFAANHKEVHLKRKDIRNVSALGFSRELKLRRGELDLLAGCPPCQGFSTLRTRNGSRRNRDPRNALVTEMVRFARAFRPKAVMMENVPGLKNNKSFLILCKSLRQLGYQISFAVKDASRYGVPQRRKRLILLAGFGFPIAFAAESKTIETVRRAISQMPAPSRTKDPLHNMPEKRRAPHIMQLIRDIPKNGGSRTDLPASRQLACHRKRNGFHDVYGRMEWDNVAPTITGGCFNPSKGRFLHPEEDRAITLREAALLQGFPRTYHFDTSCGKEALALIIGNALPPEFIRRHALQVRRALSRQKRSRAKKCK